MESHAHAQLADRVRPGVGAQRALRRHGRAGSRARVGEDGEERVALGALDPAARALDRAADERMVVAQNRVPAGAEGGGQPRRALDVRDEHRHHALRRVHSARLGFTAPARQERLREYPGRASEAPLWLKSGCAPVERGSRPVVASGGGRRAQRRGA
jgi:hypothetical protein